MGALALSVLTPGFAGCQSSAFPPLESLLVDMKSPDPAKRRGAVVFLGAYEDQQARDAMLRASRDPDWGVRRETVGHLPYTGGTGGLLALLDLLGDPEEQVRSEAAGALAQIDDWRVVGIVTPRTESEDWRIRHGAALALGEMEDPIAEGTLKRLLEDSQPEVRAAAAGALVRLGVPSLATSLQPILNDPSPAVRLAAVKAVVKLDDPSLAPALKGLVSDPDEKVARAAIDAAGKLGASALADEIAGLLGNPAMRPHAAIALGRLRDPRAYPALAEIIDTGKLRRASEIHDLHTYAREMERFVNWADATEAMGQSGDRRGVTPLLRLVVPYTEDAPIGQGLLSAAAARALGRIGDARASDAVLAAMKAVPAEHSGSWLGDPAMVYAQALADLKDHRALPTLMARLGLRNRGWAPNDKDLDRLAHTIARMADSSVVPTLMEMLDGFSASKRADAARTLGYMKAIPAAKKLGRLTRDRDYEVREAAMAALGRIGDPRGIPDLVRVLFSEGPTPAEVAAEAVGRIGDTRIVPQLIGGLRTGRGRCGSTWPVAGNCAMALGCLKANQAVDPLIHVLRSHEEDHARWEAAAALGRIGDKRAVPALVDAVKGPFWWVIREQAAKALGTLGDSSVIETLQEAGRDPNSSVREAAWDAVKAIRRRTATQPAATRPASAAPSSHL